MRRGIFGKKRGFGSWGERGQALVEFALVAVAFLFLTFGVFDLARMFQSWVTVQHASREGARFAITGLSSCSAATNRTDCIEWKAKNATTGITRGGPSALDTDVAVTYKAWDYNTWSGSGTAGATGKQCDQIEVKVTYNHRFVTPFLEAIFPSGVTISGSQRMTNEPWGVCTAGDGAQDIEQVSAHFGLYRTGQPPTVVIETTADPSRQPHDWLDGRLNRRGGLRRPQTR